MRSWCHITCRSIPQSFTVVTIEKAGNNSAFIWKKCYIFKLLADTKSKTYSKATHSIEEINIKANINYCKKFGLNIIEIEQSLPIMHWLPKMYKTRSGIQFIIASKNCSTKPVSDTISEILKMIFNTVERFHNKSFIYSCCKKHFSNGH